MKNLLNTVSNFLRDEEGLTMVEYAIAGALVAVVAITGFTALGTSVDSTATKMSGTIDAKVGG
jgi:pilus assembly protein Flp/PilA